MPIIPVVPRLYDVFANVSELHNVTFNIAIFCSDSSIELLDDMCTEPQGENKALQAYSEKCPAMQKDMQTFHGLKEKAYQFGDRLVELKTQYQQIMKEHHKSIEKTKTLEVKAQKCDKSVSDLKQRQGGLNVSSERLGDLEGQLESTKGIFKIMQRKEIQADIDKEEVTLQKISDSLKADYSIGAEAIPSRVESLLDKKTELIKEKQTQIEYTNKCEQVKDVVIREYKYNKALSDTQPKDFREISARHDALEKLPDHDDERHFRTSRDDRTWIVDRMQEQHPQNVERCQGNFAQKDQIDREKLAKLATKNIDMDLEL